MSTGIPGKRLWGQFSRLTPAVKSAIISVGVAVLVAGTVAFISWGSAPTAIGEAPVSWIDAPLHGDIIPLAPYPVVGHAQSHEGVLLFELSVEGVVMAEMDPSGPMDMGSQQIEEYDGYTLGWFGFVWTPPAPGTYLLEVRAKDWNGNWSPTAVAHVTVIGEVADGAIPLTTIPAVPTTTVPSVSTTAASTSTTTTTTTQPADSTGPVFARVSGTPGLFFQGTSGCGATVVTITALATDPSGIGAVSVFYQVVIPGVTTAGFQSDQMGSIDGDVYQATIQASNLTAIPIPPRGLPLSATLEFYVVAADAVGNQAQSTTDTSITMQVCSG